MKTRIVFILFFLYQIGFGSSPENGGAKTTDELADRILMAFQHESSEEYVDLFPSVDEFIQLINANAGFYGVSVESAKDDFKNQYNTKIIHQVKRNFSAVLQEGLKAGVVWSQAKISHLEYGSNSMDIVFKHNNLEYRLQIEKVLYVNGEWKTTQFIKLI